MKIIDAHTHIFPERIAQKAAQSIGDFYDIPMFSTALSQRLLACESEAGVSNMLVCSSAVTAKQVERINTFIHEECKQHPEFIGFAAMHPDYENVAEELDRAKELGLCGVKFHPDFQKFNIDDERAIPMYKEIAKRGMPVLFHTGDYRYDYSRLKRVYNLLKIVPDLKVIGAHFGGYSQWEEVLTLPRMENIWFDTSSSLMFMEPGMAYKLFDHFGIDRFFYGSDFPMWEPKEERKRFLDLHLSKTENEQIFHVNFEKMMGIEE